MSRFNQNLAHFLIAYRGPLLAVAIGLAGFAFFQARTLDFDRRIETMFAPDDPLLPPYQKLKDTFGGNEIVLVVYHDEGLLAEDGSGIRRLAAICEKLSQVQGVRDVLSLAAVNRVLDKVRAMNFTRTYKMLCVVDPQSVLGANYRELFAKYTHSTDGNTAAAVCMLYPQSDSQARAATVEALRAIAQGLPAFEVGEGLIVGEPAMVVDGFNYVEEDGWRLGWSTSLLLGAVIILCFRNLRWVVIPLVVVQFAVLLTKAVLVASSFQLSMVSSMLTSIVTVTGIATVIHITVNFREYRQLGLPPHESLANTIVILAGPVLWSCLTTAAGFGALLVAEAGPVQDFGLMLAIGSLFILFSVTILVPPLALLGSVGIDPQTAWGEKILDRQLQRIVAWVENSPWLVGALVTVFVGVTVIGMSFLEVESDFTKNFRADTPIVTSYEYVEDKLGGAGVWDIMLPAPRTENNASLAAEYLARVARLEKRLREEVVTLDADGGPALGALTKVVSVADADEATKVPPILNRTGASARLGKMRDELPVFYSSMLNTVGPKFEFEALASLVTLAGEQSLGLPAPLAVSSLAPCRDEIHGAITQLVPRYGYLRIMLRARERQSASQKLAVIDQVERIVDDELNQPDWHEFFDTLIQDDVAVQQVRALFSTDDWPALLANLRNSADRDALTAAQRTVEAALGPDAWKQFVAVVRDQAPRAEVTGFFVLLTNLIKSMLHDQWVCFGVATAAIAVMMLIAFRSFVLALVALVPNALPIFMVFGVMGWLGLYYEHIKINMGAAMIAAVSMGLSVDSSIHYIISFQRERAQNKTVHESLAVVQKSVGRAVVFATLALVVGFSVLCTSNFVPTIYFGVLVGLSMLGGLFGNLVVLPLLLKFVSRDPAPRERLPG